MHVFLAVASTEASHLSAALRAAAELPHSRRSIVSLFCHSATSPLCRASGSSGCSRFSSYSGLKMKSHLASCCNRKCSYRVPCLGSPRPQKVIAKSGCGYFEISHVVLYLDRSKVWFVLVFLWPGSEVHGSLKTRFCSLSKFVLIFKALSSSSHSHTLLWRWPKSCSEVATGRGKRWPQLTIQTPTARRGEGGGGSCVSACSL